MVQARNINLRFRDGNTADAGRISDLGRHTFAENFSGSFKKSDLDAYMRRYFSEEKVSADLDNSAYDYRVAEAGNTLVGYAKIGPTDLPLKSEESERLELHRLYVRGTRQGVGVGGILLSWAIERAKERGAEELCLGVSKTNRRAISVYENRGFASHGSHMIDIGSDTDEETIMSLPLRDEVKPALSA